MSDPILYDTLPYGIARIVLNRADTQERAGHAFLYELNDASTAPRRTTRSR